MNHATRFTKLALLLIVAGALALAGCGGDDGIDQSVHDMALAAQAEAEQKAADEEAARMAAEEEAAAAVTTAEEARMQAEADAAAAAQAEEDREAAAAAQAAADMKAEEEAAAAKKAEEDRMAEEAARIKAEEEAAAAEAARMKAEEARIAAEAAAAKALMDVQMAADAAAMAAKTASDAAAMDATAAMTATANIATLQTGEMSKMMAYDAKKAADGAMKAYMAAKTASEAANADDATIETATTARDMAVAAQMDAEKYAMTADEKSMGAMKYAMTTELMIDGTMKSVGDSSIDARMGTLTDTADDGSKTITGLLEMHQPMHDVGEIVGQQFDDNKDDDAPTGNTPNNLADDTLYKQAVEAGSVTIGKTLDTIDDTARLMLIDSRGGTKSVRVYGEEATPTTIVIRTDGDGRRTHAEDVSSIAASTDEAPGFRSLGVYYEATTPTGGSNDGLDALDTVADGAEPKEVFAYTNPAVANDDTIYTVETLRSIDGDGNTDITYTSVDTTAAAAPDNFDSDTNPQQVGVMASIPAAVKYDHLHFGVWANLGEAKKDGTQELADLGIGFVQNFSNSGMTERQITGTATFNGNWAGAVQEAHDADSIALANGPAALTANFDRNTFQGVLTGLATLEGSLSGNGFSGTKATVGENTHGLTAGGTFSGMFEGGIYGPAGEEAGGVFDFSSTSDGAFRGAFGGARD